MGSKEQVQELLSHAGITINGPNPWDIQVKDERFYDRVLSQANLGAGESYMDGWWECKDLDQLFYRILNAEIEKKIRPLHVLPLVVKSKVLNMQTVSKSKTVAQEHYDAGNDLYKIMLDKNMQYTCGYWKKAKNLDKAQEDKLDLVCKKLGLKKGMKVLELGGGFGGLARWMASKYGCEVTTYNISKEQVAYGREWCKGLKVTFMEADYREAAKLPPKTFDRVVSIGMLEHVGHKNYKSFFQLISHNLKDEGIALVHSIASSKTVWFTDPWINKYIFPHGHLPSIKQIGGAIEGLFVMEDWHNFGADYDKTLMAWNANCVKGWPKIQDKYNERFYRMWRYYLLTCAGGFRARKMQLWQIVLTKKGMPGGYQRPEL